MFPDTSTVALAVVALLGMLFGDQTPSAAADPSFYRTFLDTDCVIRGTAIVIRGTISPRKDGNIHRRIEFQKNDAMVAEINLLTREDRLVGASTRVMVPGKKEQVFPATQPLEAQQAILSALGVAKDELRECANTTKPH